MIALQPATASMRSGADLIIHLLERQACLSSQVSPAARCCRCMRH